MTGPQSTEEIVALFRKAISFQDRNRLELVFETEEEADAAGDFLLRLGDDVPDATPKANPEEAAIKLTCEDCGTAAWLPKIGREGEFVALKPADGWELYPHRRCPACVAKQSTRTTAK